MSRSSVVHVVRLADIAPARWRNGGGATRELLAWPSEKGWALRLSVAEIERDGPFSAFPGVQRWFAVIEGAGVELRWGADRICSIRPCDEVLQFDGGIAPDCRLLNGPTQDLNLMLTRGRGGLQRPLPGEPLALQAPFKAIYVADAVLLHRVGAASQALAAGSLAWSDAAAGERWTLEAGAGMRALAVVHEPESER